MPEPTVEDLAQRVRLVLAEDERVARRAADDASGMGLAYNAQVRWRNSDGNVYLDGGYGGAIAVGGYNGPIGDAVADHMARHDPERVLRDVTSQRAMLDEILSWGHEKDHRENDCFPTPFDGGCWCGRDNRVKTLLRLMLQEVTEDA